MKTCAIAIIWQIYMNAMHYWYVVKVKSNETTGKYSKRKHLSIAIEKYFPTFWDWFEETVNPAKCSKPAFHGPNNFVRTMKRMQQIINTCVKLLKTICIKFDSDRWHAKNSWNTIDDTIVCSRVKNETKSSRWFTTWPTSSPSFSSKKPEMLKIQMRRHQRRGKLSPLTCWIGTETGNVGLKDNYTRVEQHHIRSING